MLTDRYPELSFPLTPELARRLPRSPAYRYRVQPDEVQLTPEPRCGHGVLTISSAIASDASDLRLPSGWRIDDLQASDWPRLLPLFLDAYSTQLPFSVLSGTEAEELAIETLEGTRLGADGSLVPDCCLVLRTAERTSIAAALLVTVLPAGNLSDFSDSAWQQTPPPQPHTQAWGRPHLTWVLTSPSHQRQGHAKLLLMSVLPRIAAWGYTELASTFQLDNVPSLLWHWRMGFALQGAGVGGRGSGSVVEG